MWESKLLVFLPPSVFTENKNKQLRKKLFNNSQVMNTDLNSGSLGEASVVFPSTSQENLKLNFYIVAKNKNSTRLRKVFMSEMEVIVIVIQYDNHINHASFN